MAEEIKYAKNAHDLRVKKNPVIKHPRRCEKPGCENGGEFRAPKSRQTLRDYYWFCLDHVREYNKSYNYFSGLPDEAVAKHQKDDMIGHRPTWFVGVNAWSRSRASKGGARRNGFAHRFTTSDPFGLFPEREAKTKPGTAEARPIRRAERKCLRQLNLEDTATKADIRARFKELVKRLHPDHNKGDRSSEDKLREVIQAYNYLRQAGLA